MRAATCHPDRPQQARGLCSSCYSREHHAGRHLDYPPTRNRQRALALAEDAAWVRTCRCPCGDVDVQAYHGKGRGCPCGGVKALAARLGVRADALRKALYRARQYQAA